MRRESAAKEHCPFTPQSPVFALPGGAVCELPLFATAAANSSAAPSSSDDAALCSADAQDLVLNAGGPVWALDWCPAAVELPAAGPSSSGDDDAGGSTSGGTVEYLAVGCHPQHAQINQIGKLIRGRCSIQLWEVWHPHQPAALVCRPRLALALVHDGGLAWHCRWCPRAGLADSLGADGGAVLPRLGLLAVALGDGTLRVWAVPQPRVLGGGAAAAGAPPAAALEPVALLSHHHLGGSTPAVVDWLPGEPHDLLLVGCWDGTVAIARLLPPQLASAGSAAGAVAAGAGMANGTGGSSSGPRGLELLAHFPADACPLRAVRWVPPRVCAAVADGAARALFLTAGHEGVLRLWDARDQFQPLYCHTMSSNAAALGAAWTAVPFGVLLSMEDASIRGVPLDSALIAEGASRADKALFAMRWSGGNMGALWALEVHPASQLVAYGGEDGEVGLFVADYEGDSRRRVACMWCAWWAGGRAPHVPLAATRQAEGGALRLLSASQIRRHGLFAGRVVERQKNVGKHSRLPAEAEAVHRVAWAAGSEAGAWLASGGAAGLVRCQWARRQVVVRAERSEQAMPAPLLAVAGFAAAALLHVAPAQAGVKLVQPEVKNFITDAAPAAGSGKAAAKAAAPKARVSEMSGAPDLRALTLPVSVVGIAVAGYAATKADEGFLEVLDRGSLKDSNLEGVGYEANSGLKDSYFFADGGAKEVFGVKTGAPKKAPAKKAGAAKK
eukprot:scaffold3.g6678.t1